MANNEHSLLTQLLNIFNGANGGAMSSPLGNTMITVSSKDNEYDLLRKLVEMASGVGGGITIQVVSITNVNLNDLPTEDPHIVGKPWLNGAFVCSSQG